jgi:hypothetical protein
LDDLLDWSSDEFGADDAGDYQEEIYTYLKSKGMIKESKLTEAGLPSKIKKMLDTVDAPIELDDLLDWSSDEFGADDAGDYQEEIYTYLKSKGMIKESKLTEDDKEFEPDSQPEIDQVKDPANPTPAEGEEEEQDTVTKEYVGKTEDTHFYMVSTPGQTDEAPADMQIVDQEGTQKYSAKEQNLDPADPANFIIQAIQELEIDEITRSVLVKYILPMLEEDETEEEEKPEGMEDETGAENEEAGDKNVEPTNFEKDNESKVNEKSTAVEHLMSKLKAKKNPSNDERKLLKFIKQMDKDKSKTDESKVDEAKPSSFATVVATTRGEVVEDFTAAIEDLFGGHVYDRSKPELTYAVVSKKPLSKSDLKIIDQEEDLEKVNDSKVNENDPATKQEGEDYFRGELIKYLEKMGDRLTPEEKDLLVKAKKERTGPVPNEAKVPDDKDPEATKIKKLIETFVQMGDDRFEVEHIDDGTPDTVIAINGQEYRFDQDFASMWRDEATGELSKDGLTELALDALSNMEEEEYDEVKAAGDERSDDQIEDEEAARVRDVKLDMRDDDLEDQRRERGTAEESKANEKKRLPDALKNHMFKKGGKGKKKDEECKEAKVNGAVVDECKEAKVNEAGLSFEDWKGKLEEFGTDINDVIKQIKKGLLETDDFIHSGEEQTWDGFLAWEKNNNEVGIDFWVEIISDRLTHFDEALPCGNAFRSFAKAIIKELGLPLSGGEVDEKTRCTKREKRQVKHIEKGEKTAGQSAKKAKEIAYATVNKLKTEGKVNEDKTKGPKGMRGTDLLKDLLGLG